MTYARPVATKPIRVLVIHPDNTHEVKEIPQDLPTWQQLVGGYLERAHTEHADLWFDEEGKLKGCPVNRAATYLWWKLAPEMEGQDVIQGPCFVTGLDDEAAYSEPVRDEVVELFERISRAITEEINGDLNS